MRLGALQNALETFYELDVGYQVDDFLITDRELARLLDPGGRCSHREKLLFCEDDEDLHLSLFVDDAVCRRMRPYDHHAQVPPQRFDDFCLMVEGVSHFVYLCWNAKHKRQMTLLEMELQAEVDKYLTIAGGCVGPGASRRGAVAGAPVSPDGAMHRRLFEDYRLDPGLTPLERERYQRANHYAGKYCWSLQQRYANGRAGGTLRRELRRFYRKPQAEKLRMIESPHAGSA